jgi:hypothetical protein
MRTPSIRTLAAIAYERGEEFDPALMLSPALAEQLDGMTAAGTTVFAFCSSPGERGGRLQAGPSKADGQEDLDVTDEDEAPSWFEAGDLVPRLPDTRHGELLAELAC